MKKIHKIAIYSGSIPSTTFVERLILGLSKNECQIYLFGLLNKKVNYNSSIKLYAYKNTKSYKAFYLLKYTLLLLCFKSKDKRKLDNILNSKSQNTLLDKVKCYPVLWHQPDVFHVQWAKSLEYWSWVQDFNIKLVLSLRGAHINYSPIANATLADSYKTYFPKVDRFHAVSKAISKEAEKYGAPPNKIDVVYSGLDLKAFKSSSNPENPNFNIVSVGRSHWKKGYHYALDACKILKERNVSFAYTIVGAKDYLEVMYQIKDLDLEDDVVLLKSMPIDEVKQKIQSASVLLLPSVEEGIANVVLEAMASRTIVLTTNCGGMEEVVQDKINGFVCPIRDAKAMAEQLIKIEKISNAERESILDKAQRKIEEQHTEAQMVSNMLNLYGKVLNEERV
ncbi:glycosyltransferase family 4 protein [Psychroserpens sp.]|uniref:glycosyltransferase family 4 protein n=1 Tax=Psychroserpens sp. TaxID=2020870 RepID=UPI00385B0C2D